MWYFLWVCCVIRPLKSKLFYSSLQNINLKALGTLQSSTKQGFLYANLNYLANALPIKIYAFFGNVKI